MMEMVGRQPTPTAEDLVIRMDDFGAQASVTIRILSFRSEPLTGGTLRASLRAEASLLMAASLQLLRCPPKRYLAYAARDFAELNR